MILLIKIFQTPNAPNGLIAGWWRDMYVTYDLALNKGISLATFGSGWLIEFDDSEDYWDPGLTMDYEIIAYYAADPLDGFPDIMVAFDNVVGDWDPQGTVGVENTTGKLGTTFAYDSWVPEDGDIVCFDYVVADSQPVVITFDVTVDNVEDEGITNTVSHDADGFGMEEEEAWAIFKVNLTLTDLDLYSSLDEMDWDMVPGSFEEGFGLLMDPLEEYYYLDADNLVVNRPLVNGYHSFYLDQTDLPAGFFEYWDAKGVNGTDA